MYVCGSEGAEYTLYTHSMYMYKVILYSHSKRNDLAEKKTRNQHAQRNCWRNEIAKSLSGGTNPPGFLQVSKRQPGLKVPERLKSANFHFQ